MGYDTKLRYAITIIKFGFFSFWNFTSLEKMLGMAMIRSYLYMIKFQSNFVNLYQIKLESFRLDYSLKIYILVLEIDMCYNWLKLYVLASH